MHSCSVQPGYESVVALKQTLLQRSPNWREPSPQFLFSGMPGKLDLRNSGIKHTFALFLKQVELLSLLRPCPSSPKLLPYAGMQAFSITPWNTT